MTCIIKVFVIPSLSHHILSTYPSMSPHVTIFLHVYVLIVITAEEGPRTETFCNIVVNLLRWSNKILQLWNTVNVHEDKEEQGGRTSTVQLHLCQVNTQLFFHQDNICVSASPGMLFRGGIGYWSLSQGWSVST